MSHCLSAFDLYQCTFSTAGLLILHIYVIRLTTGQKLRPRIGLNLKAQAVKIFTQGAEKARELHQGKFFLKEYVKSLTFKLYFLIKTEFEILLSVYQKWLDAFRDKMNVKPFETNILKTYSKRNWKSVAILGSFLAIFSPTILTSFFTKLRFSGSFWSA